MPPAGLDAIIADTESALGPIDVLVNNAAAAFYLPYTETSEKRFRVANDINWFAPWRLCQLVVPGMRARGEGWILNISSATSDRPTAETFKDFDALSILYGSTKAALERFTAGLAAAVHKDGIWVNSMAPVGAVPTEGTEALGVVPDDAVGEARQPEGDRTVGTVARGGQRAVCLAPMRCLIWLRQKLSSLTCSPSSPANMSTEMTQPFWLLSSCSSSESQAQMMASS